MKTLQTALCMGFLMVATAGFSQVFDDFDNNRDGSIDQDEFNGVYSNNFSNWDANGDGNLDDREFYDRTFNRLDANRDGNLDDDEWNEGSNMYGDRFGTDINQFDGNGDGIISAEEYYNGFSDSDFYGSYDSNMDSSIDGDEFNQSVFSNWDENGDGILDSTEYDRYSGRYID